MQSPAPPRGRERVGSQLPHLRGGRDCSTHFIKGEGSATEGRPPPGSCCSPAGPAVAIKRSPRPTPYLLLEAAAS